ncbi:MAG: hypothetical protein ACK42K_08175, partial [Leptonema sp. (in: bacteria)]
MIPIAIALWGDKSPLLIASWIKNLVNRTGITFCLVGLPEFESIIKDDTQLARRFPLSFKFRNLQYSPNKNGT